MRTSTPGSRCSSRSASGAREAREAAPRGAGAPISTYVVPRSRATRATTSATSSPSSTSTVRAEQRPEPAQRVELLGLLGAGLAARARATVRMSSSAPSRCAERQARRTTRCEDACGVTSASSRSPTACGTAWPSTRCSSRTGARLAHEPLGLDALGDLAQRDLAQRLEVLDPEEAVERGRHALGLVDLAGPQPLDQRRRRDVDEHDLVGGGEHGVGERLAHAHAGELGDLVVERLEVLDVDGREHVDAGGEHVGDVLVALGVLGARRVRVRELVDQRELRRRASSRAGPSRRA